MKKTKTEAPFWDHVVELRNRMLWVVAAVVVFSIAGYIIFPYFVQFISGILGEKLYINTIAEGFFTRMDVSLIFGCICALPLFIIQVCLFTFPGLTGHEKSCYGRLSPHSLFSRQAYFLPFNPYFRPR